MTTIVVTLVVWGFASVLALALAKSAQATADEYNEPGEHVTVWEIIRS